MSVSVIFFYLFCIFHEPFEMRDFFGFCSFLKRLFAERDFDLSVRWNRDGKKKKKVNRFDSRGAVDFIFKAHLTFLPWSFGNLDYR